MKKVLIIGAGVSSSYSLTVQALKEKHGEVAVYTPEQAEAEGLTLADFENVPTIPIIGRHPVDEISEVKSGRELRRERRKKRKK